MNEEALKKLRWECEGWIFHFSDFLKHVRKHPPDDPKRAVTAALVMARDSLEAFESFRERIERELKNG